MWYIIQTIVFCTIVYYYISEIAPTASVGAIILLAYLAAFAVTELLSMALDAIYKLNRLLRTILARLAR